MRPPATRPDERVETPLTGLWQIARWDELTVKEEDRTRPIEAVPGAERLLWYGIDVPGDRNEKRPDMAYCHRYVYRTRVDVPADLGGRAFFLHFGATNLIASVIVNGQFCGSNAAPFAIWDCDVTKAMQPGKTNEILVAVKDAYYGVTNPRELFNLPMGFFQFQGASNAIRLCRLGPHAERASSSRCRWWPPATSIRPTSLRFPRSANGSLAWRSRCTTPPPRPRP